MKGEERNEDREKKGEKEKRENGKEWRRIRKERGRKVDKARIKAELNGKTENKRKSIKEKR